MYGELMGIAMVLSFAISLSITRKIEDRTTPLFNNAVRIVVGVVTFNLAAILGNTWLLIFNLPIKI